MQTGFQVPEANAKAERNDRHKFLEGIIGDNRGEFIEGRIRALVPGIVRAHAGGTGTGEIPAEASHAKDFQQFYINRFGVVYVAAYHVLTYGNGRTSKVRRSIQVLRGNNHGAVNAYKIKSQNIAFFHAILVADSHGSAHAVATGIRHLQVMADP